MTWNFRVIRRTDLHGNHYYTIHEVYTNGSGSIGMWSKDAIHAQGDTLGELKQELEWMLDALKKPVLKEVDDKLVEVGEDLSDSEH